jgi:hypothetical protein
MKKLRTEGEASLLLHEYERANSDLPNNLVQYMGAFHVAPKVSPAILSKLYGLRDIGTTFTYHRAAFWYLVFTHSDTLYLWDEFLEMKNSGEPMRDCLVRMRRKMSTEEWDLFSLRAKGARLNPHDYSRRRSKSVVWTAGGCWDIRSGITKILVLGEHLEHDLNYNMITRKLTPSILHTIETELHNYADFSMNYYDVVHSCVRYLKGRLEQVSGWVKKGVGPETCAWFFDTYVPKPHHDWLWVDKEGLHQRRQTSWIPSK